MNPGDILSQIDLSKVPEEEAVPLATALLSLLIAEHPALWLEIVGDRSLVGYDTIMEFMRLAPIRGSLPPISRA